MHNPLIFSAILVFLHQPSLGYSEIHFYCDIHSEIAEIHVSGIINPNRINNKLAKSNLINGHELNSEPVPLNPENTSKKMTATVFSI